MRSVRTTIVVAAFAMGATLSLAPVAGAASFGHGAMTASGVGHPASKPCHPVRAGVWWCTAAHYPTPVYHDNVPYEGTPFRWIGSDGFETNCKNDNGLYSGPGPYQHRWEYTTWGGEGGWVPDTDVRDDATNVQYCP